MERLEVYVPPPMAETVEEHQQQNGFDNRSQAIRDLLRRGLDGETA